MHAGHVYYSSLGSRTKDRLHIPQSTSIQGARVSGWRYRGKCLSCCGGEAEGLGERVATVIVYTRPNRFYPLALSLPVRAVRTKSPTSLPFLPLSSSSTQPPPKSDEPTSSAISPIHKLFSMEVSLQNYFPVNSSVSHIPAFLLLLLAVALRP